MKQRVPITSTSSKFKGATQHYLVKLPKSAGARHYCPKTPRVPGTLGTRANSSPVSSVLCLGNCDQNKECSWNSIAMTLILMTFFCPLILKTSRISFTRIRSTFNMRLCDMEIWVVKFPRDEYKIRQIVG